MRKAGTLAIVCVQYTICASVPGEGAILKLYPGSTAYAKRNVFSEFNISSRFFAVEGPMPGHVVGKMGVLGFLWLVFLTEIWYRIT